jgi:hypothetical protein
VNIHPRVRDKALAAYGPPAANDYAPRAEKCE